MNVDGALNEGDVHQHVFLDAPISSCIRAFNGRAIPIQIKKIQEDSY